jgi:hypothetical protein
MSCEDVTTQFGWVPDSLREYDVKRAFVKAARTSRGIDYSVMLPLIDGQGGRGSRRLADCCRPEYAELIVKGLKAL